MFEEAGWINKIITAGIIAMIGWTLLTVQNVSLDVAVLQSKLESVETSIKISNEDRYTRAEAIANRSLLEQRILRLETQFDRLQRTNNATGPYE